MADTNNDNKTEKGTADLSDPTDRQAADSGSTCSAPSNLGQAQEPIIGKRVKAPTKKSSSHTVKSNGRPLLDFIECLKRCGIKYRQHEFLGVQIDLGDGKGWRNATKEMHAFAYTIVNNKCRLAVKVKKDTEIRQANFRKVDRLEAIDAMLHKYRYNPLSEYFDKLTAEEWSDAWNLLEMVFKLDPPEYVVGKYADGGEGMAIYHYYGDGLLLIGKGLYCRTLTPASNFPFFPIFPGSQGIGKSLFIEQLLPPAIAAEVYMPKFDMSLDQKERSLLVNSAALIEASEMAGHSRRDVATNKAFIRSNYSHVRRPYSAHPEVLPRRDIIIGTTNEPQFMPVDPSGDRAAYILPIDRKRGWTKESCGGEIKKVMAEFRDKFWAHIKWLIEVKKELPSELYWHETTDAIRVAILEESEKRLYPIEAAITELIPTCPDQPFDDRLTWSETGEGIPLDVPPTSTRRSIMKLLTPKLPAGYSKDLIGKKMTRMGWTDSKSRVTIDGKRLFLKIPPRRK